MVRKLINHLKYYLVLALIPTLLNIIIFAFLPLIDAKLAYSPGAMAIYYFMIPFWLILTYIGLLASLLIWSAIVHLFGGKDFLQTVKAMAYSYTPTAIFGGIASVIMIVIISGITGGNPTESSSLTETLAPIFAMAAISIVIGLWSLYNNITGLSVLHGISKIRALLANVIPAVIIGAIFAFFILMFIFIMASAVGIPPDASAPAYNIPPIYPTS